MKPVNPAFSKEKISKLKVFTDRIEARELFRNALDEGNAHPDEMNVISCYGIGGSGKSRLLEEFRNEMKKSSYVFASYDFENGSDRLLVISRLSRQLTKKGFSFPLTRVAEITYDQKSGVPVYAEVKEDELLDDPMLGIIADFIPGLSSVLDCIDKGKTVYKKLQEYYGKVCTLWDNDKKELDRTLKRIGEMDEAILIRYLPEFFRIDLQNNIKAMIRDHKKLPVVLMLDTFENCVNTYKPDSVFEAADYWLYNDVIKRIPGVLWIIASREKLNWAAKDSFYDGMTECMLSDFSREDAYSYLHAAGIPEDLHEHLFELSGGVPLLLDVSVDTYYERKSDYNTVTADDFGKSSDDLIGRFFRYMKEIDRQIAVFLCYLGKWIDEDIRRFGKKVLGEKFDFADYLSFLTHSIIIKDKEQRYYIHESVRRIIQEVSSDARYSEIVKKTQEAVKDRLIVSENSPVAGVAESIADLASMEERQTISQQTVNEIKKKNEETYRRYNENTLIKWGPDRPAFTMKSPAGYPVLNSINDNNILGDEISFARLVMVAPVPGKTYVSTLKVKDGDTVSLYAHFDNGCSPSLKEEGIIRNLHVSVNAPSYVTPEYPGEFRVFFYADNTKPLCVWYTPKVISDEELEITYVKGSAKYYSHGAGERYLKGVKIDESIFSTKGAILGADQLDGMIPASGTECSGHVILHFEFKKRVHEPQLHQENDRDYIAGLHWGPVRQTFSYNAPPNVPVFNSIIDNPNYGDERNFFRIQGYEQVHRVKIEPGKIYTAELHYFNDCDGSQNKKGIGIAPKVKVSVKMPEMLQANEITIMQGMVESPRAERVFDQVNLICDQSVRLEFQPSTARLFNHGKLSGTPLGTQLFNEGIYIGVHKFNGFIPAGTEYSGTVIFDFKAVLISE